MSLSRAQRARLQQIARGRSDEALRILEGLKAVRDALALGVVEELWIRGDLADEASALLRRSAAEHGCRIVEGSPAEFERLSSTVSPQGVLALVRDTAREVSDVVAGDGTLLWLDGVQDPGNVGAIVRVAAGFGAGGLLLSADSADPLGLKALRASTGHALRVPFARAPAEDIVQTLSECGRPIWTLESGGEDVFEVVGIPEGLVLAVGSEGRGLSESVRSAASKRVGISLAVGVESLNAAVAIGIAVAWLTRETS